MALSDESNDSMWNQSVCNKSWADIMEEEEEERMRKLNKSISNSPLLRDSTNFKSSPLAKIKEEPIDVKRIKEEPLDENACDTHVNVAKNIVIQPSDVLPNFSASYTNSSTSLPIKKENDTKAEKPREFLNEDLSLTSHLNVFKLVSPCKVEPKTPTKKTPVKKTLSYFLRSDRKEVSSESKLIKRKLQTDDAVESEISDELLMPSPSKIRRQNTPMKTPTDKFINRKRSREITPGKRSSEKKTPREIESDTDVLARRQKQIDYGKNTIGYDRYRQLVPREARKKMHPRTPPLHLKFSRRAWDGLIKVWRQRLHFWDPPSEGGGDPACLEGPSDMSDTSSTDGSQPNTPVQDKKRQDRKKSWVLGSRGLLRSSMQPEIDDDDDDNQGCTPLPLEENVP